MHLLTLFRSCHLVSDSPSQVVWRIVVSALSSIDEVNLRRARLALRWATVSGFNSRCRTLISVCKEPAIQSQLSLPSIRGP